MEVHQKIMACLKEGSQFNTLPKFTPPIRANHYFGKILPDFTAF